MLGPNGEYSTLSKRMRAIRVDLFGENGAFLLASLLGIPEGKLTRMEANGPISAHLVLAFIAITGANPRWLQSGVGEMYSRLVAGGRVGWPWAEGRRPASFE